MCTKPVIEALDLQKQKNEQTFLEDIIFSLLNAIIITVVTIGFEKRNSSVDTIMVNYIFELHT